MIQRDIKGLSPQQINELQAPQSGFSAGTQDKGVYAPPATPTVMSQILGLAQAAEPAITKLKTDAYKQGQVDFASDTVGISNTVDRAAKLIKDSSWLTSDMYGQGVKFQQYTEGQLKTQQAISQAAVESIAKGESLEMFSQNIKPHLNELNKHIHDLGLTGASKAAAQDQLLTYVATSQKQYQSELEADTQRRVASSTNNISAGAIESIANARGNGAVIGQALSSSFDNIFQFHDPIDPAGALTTSSAQMASTIKNTVQMLQLNDPEDISAANAIESWLYSDASSKMDSKSRRAALKAVQSKQVEMRTAQTAYDDQYVNEIEFNVKQGIPVSDDLLVSYNAQLIERFQKGTMTVDQLKGFSGRVWEARTAQHKAMGKENLALNGKPHDILAAGETQEWQTKTAAQSISRDMVAAGTPEMIPTAMIAAGILTVNMGTVKAGAALGANAFMPTLLQTPEAITQAEDGLANDAYLAFSAQYKKANTDGNATLADAILSGIADPLDRSAMRAVLKEGGPSDLPTLSKQLADHKAKLEIFKKRGGMQGVKIDVASLPEDAFYGQFFGLATGGQAALGYGQSDRMKAIRAEQLNAHFNVVKDEAIQGGHYFQTGEEAFAYLKSSGNVVLTNSGYVPITNEAKRAMSLDGNMVTPERVADIMDAAVVHMQNQVGPDRLLSNNTVTDKAIAYARNAVGLPRKIDPKNVTYEFVNGNMFVYARDDEGVPMEVGHYDPTEQAMLGNLPKDSIIESLHNMALDVAGEIRNATGTHNKMRTYPNGYPITSVMNGPNGNRQPMEIYPDTGVFGSNALKEDIIHNILRFEGSVNVPTATNKKAGYEKIITIGNGILLSTIKDYFGDNAVTEYTIAAQNMGSPHYARLYDQFLNKHFESLPNLFADAGLPPVSDSFWSSTAPYEAMADTQYHRPADAIELADIYNLAREDKMAAIKRVHALKSFNAAQPERQQLLLDAIDEL